MTAAPSEESNRESFFSQINRHLKELYRFVRHQLAYSESVGDLIPGELSPEEVVDEVLLRAYREFVKNPTQREMRAWLLQLARKQLAAASQTLESGAQPHRPHRRRYSGDSSDRRGLYLGR